ncbi:ABC transporter ATP-binding protein [Clostridium sp. MSJ-4]|uniref:ABC transporter ATP-binding protein n=1 Tax=Clostridium simiarum TaxID=2841506 RepID=A0ABS6F3S8_9CLOT|nr:ABC transporter ATP-binding protein [Clostridium simiarum]MBU5593128.1 ABC transporter ATP-binding protein [Clostridium simiarum]
MKHKNLEKPLLDIKDLSFAYSSREILKDINMELFKGDIVSIIGPNGAGKSTLLKAIANILSVKKGNITIKDMNLKDIPLKELAKIQGYVPQNYNSSFKINVMEVMLMGRKPHVSWSVTKEDLKVVERVAEYLGLQSMIQKDITELSGGERQKVMMAKALVQEPDILLLDEPTSALDIKYQLEVLNLLNNLSEKENKLVIMVMHNLEMAARFSNKLILLKSGKIHSFGEAEEVLTEENIRDVYEVEVKILKDDLGFRVVPLKGI